MVLLVSMLAFPVADFRSASETSSLTARGHASRIALEATQTPAGPVRVSWRLVGGAPPATVTILRAVHIDGLEPSRDPQHPTARWTVTGGVTDGSFIDPAPADGVDYWYQVIAGDGNCNVAAVSTRARRVTTVRAPRLHVDKATYVMTLLDGNRIIRRFPIALGRAPQRRKLHFDNASTPEGVYRVTGLQPHATFYKAFDIDYPNAIDRVRHDVARTGQPGFPAIGGEIQIHAGGGIESNWTFGCVAMRNADIDALFASQAVRVGTQVRIWGGELTKTEVDGMALAPPPATVQRWRAALAGKGFPAAGPWGPSLWTAIGRYQRAEGLRVTCWPDADTARRLGLLRDPQAISNSKSRLRVVPCADGATDGQPAG